MRTLSMSQIGGMLVMLVLQVMILVGAGSANVTDGYPGHPNAWEGMTTNMIIRIDVDRPVAMSGDQPDLDYTVKKAAFDGFDFVVIEVLCDVEVSDDRKTIRLYPQGLLEKDSFYAYKLERIVFDDGTEQEYTQCYATGNNPAQFLKTAVSEIDMCDESSSNLAWASWCGKCHEEWESAYPCVLTPND